MGGTSTASHAAVHAQRSPSRTSTPLPTRLRTISSTKKGLPPARVATKSWSCAEDVADRGAEQAGHERARVVGRERGEPDHRLRGAGHERRARVGPVREQEHQRPVRQLIDDVPHEVHRGRVGPVQILDEDQERLLLEPPLDQGARGQHDLALELLGLDVGMGSAPSSPST